MDNLIISRFCVIKWTRIGLFINHYKKRMKLGYNNTISMKYDIKRMVGKKNREIITIKRKENQRKSTTESPERVYFCSFLSLKLILEMEDLGLGKTIIGSYKIDRDFYKEWNLDAILHLRFHKWWEMYKTMFEPPPIELNQVL